MGLCCRGGQALNFSLLCELAPQEHRHGGHVPARITGVGAFRKSAVTCADPFRSGSRPCAVPVKTVAQQDLQAVHRVRERLVCQRTSLMNQVRGLLTEYGIVLAKGPYRLAAEGPPAIAEASLSDLARELFASLFDQLRDLDGRVKTLDTRLLTICRENAASRRLAAVPGIGPVIATALIASIDDGQHFRSGRELAAWIGLVPRQHTTGGKPKLGRIGKQANHYLRRQMIHGARSVAFRISGRDDYRSKWLRALVARRGFNRAVVALANKTARIAWALLTRQEIYRAA